MKGQYHDLQALFEALAAVLSVLAYTLAGLTVATLIVWILLQIISTQS